MSRGEVSTVEEMPLERLEAEITELAGQLAAGECRWLQLVAEYDRRSPRRPYAGCSVTHPPSHSSAARAVNH